MQISCHLRAILERLERTMILPLAVRGIVKIPDTLGVSLFLVVKNSDSAAAAE
jgi:hypothetical protein